MSKQRVHRDSVTGEYVSAEYAEAHPDTTQAEWIEIGPVTSQLESLTVEATELLESRPSWTLTLPGGIQEMGTDPTEMLERALYRARDLVSGEATS